MKKHSFLLNSKKKNRKIIGILTLLAIFSVLAVNVFPPQFRNFNTVKQQLKSQASLIKLREEKTKRLLAIKEDYMNLKDKVQETYGVFFSAEEVPDFLKSISNLAEQETNNNLLSMQPMPEEIIQPLLPDKGEGFFYKKKIIKLSIDGSFRTIEKLITRFDNYKKLLRIEGITLRHEGRASRVRAKLNLAMYILPGKGEKLPTEKRPRRASRKKR